MSRLKEEKKKKKRSDTTVRLVFCFVPFYLIFIVIYFINKSNIILFPSLFILLLLLYRLKNYVFSLLSLYSHRQTKGILIFFFLCLCTTEFLPQQPTSSSGFFFFLLSFSHPKKKGKFRRIYFVFVCELRRTSHNMGGERKWGEKIKCLNQKMF